MGWMRNGRTGGFRSLARRVGVGASVALVLTLVAAPARASTISASAPVRMCTNLDDSSCYAAFTLSAKTTVTMTCWRDEDSYNGTKRWFWVSGGGVSGFVSASQVSGQTSVGGCSGNRQVEAIRWAGSYLKQNSYVNECQSFVHAAYKAAGYDIGSATTAYNYWKSNPKKLTKSTGTNPPAGALVYWGPTSGYPEGHVALSIGNGRAISTYERSTKEVHILSIADRNKTKPYLGYLTVPK